MGKKSVTAVDVVIPYEIYHGFTIVKCSNVNHVVFLADRLQLYKHSLSTNKKRTPEKKQRYTCRYSHLLWFYYSESVITFFFFLADQFSTV